jgi:hypothetical protein
MNFIADVQRPMKETAPMLRLTVIIFCISGLFALSARFAGLFIQAEIITEYLRIENQIYVVLMRDPIHNVYLPMAGRGCYEALPLDPALFAVIQHNQIIYIEQFQVRSDSSRELVARIKSCIETVPSSTMQGQENFR